MKKALLWALVPIFCLTFLTGCIPGFYTVGTLYTSVKTPASAVAYYGPQATTAAKVAKVTTTNILGIIATGDASLEAAMREAGIKKVHHVDQEVTSILGLWSTYSIYVYGE